MTRDLCDPRLGHRLAGDDRASDETAGQDLCDTPLRALRGCYVRDDCALASIQT